MLLLPPPPPPPLLGLSPAADYGFADVEYHTKMYGHDKNVIHTPNLDRLAAAGVKLENYYVQPVCSPTRSTIMTGRYVIHTGIHTAFSDSVPNVLPIEEVTVAQHLAAAGYATHMIGVSPSSSAAALATHCSHTVQANARRLRAAEMAPWFQDVEVHADGARLRLAPRLLRGVHRLLHPGLPLLARLPVLHILHAHARARLWVGPPPRPRDDQELHSLLDHAVPTADTPPGTIRARVPYQYTMRENVS